MIIEANKFGDASNFSVPFIEAVKSMSDGDTLSFEKKEYHFYKDFSQFKNIHFTNTDSFKNPKKYFGMLIENLNNIKIEGNGATFVIHGDICSFALIGCNNVKLENFTIRYASPNCVELKVKEIKGNKITYSIPSSTLWYIDQKRKNKAVFFEQSPFTKQNYWEFANDENSHCSALHSEDKTLVKRINHPECAFASVKSMERKSETELQISYKRKRKYKLGDTIALATNANRNTCGIFFGESKNVESKNITVNYMAGFGWLSQMCENLTFDKINFIADKDHVVTSFADLLHICGCKGNVSITNSHFESAHDDAINIHGSFMRFKKKVDDYTAEFEFVHHQQGGHRNFFAGDKTMFFYRTTLSEIDSKYYTVKEVVDDIENKTCTVTFNEKLPDEIEQKKHKQSNVVIENKSYCPNVEIANCEFTAIPTRDVLCTTSGKVRIHDNVFSYSQMACIFISNDAFAWYESGPVRDVEIYSNKFLMCPSIYKRHPGVLIKPIPFMRRVNKHIHKNITIRNNLFMVGRDVPIRAYGVDGLNIYGNVYEGSHKVITRACKKVK